MARKLWVLVVVLLLTSACANEPEPEGTQATPSRTPVSSPQPSHTAQPEPQSGSDTSPAERVAARLTNVNSNLYELIDVWLTEVDGKPRGAKFRTLEALGLKKQKMMRRLVKRPKLSSDVLPLLEGALQRETKRNIHAARDLYVLTKPLKPPVRMKTSKASPPKKLMRHYTEGERRFGVPWSVLAAVNLVESKMGRLNGPSSSGALGPMQFMPATWEAYGHGSPFKPYNAIMAAARYLSASGAPERLRDALWNYNHSEHYVNAVIDYHRFMHSKPKSYFSYYFWQVFVRTTKGDKQLTGPGSNYPY